MWLDLRMCDVIPEDNRIDCNRIPRSDFHRYEDYHGFSSRENKIQTLKHWNFSMLSSSTISGISNNEQSWRKVKKQWFWAQKWPISLILAIIRIFLVGIIRIFLENSNLTLLPTFWGISTGAISEISNEQI